jgi:hypothetical protein
MLDVIVRHNPVSRLCARLSNSKEESIKRGQIQAIDESQTGSEWPPWIYAAANPEGQGGIY